MATGGSSQTGSFATSSLLNEQTEPKGSENRTGKCGAGTLSYFQLCKEVVMTQDLVEGLGEVSRASSLSPSTMTANFVAGDEHVASS
jgi:hypothetical protein